VVDLVTMLDSLLFNGDSTKRKTKEIHNDHIIFFSFLIINVILGLKSSKGITSITLLALVLRSSR
jgi:hypothetical protein